MAPKSNVTTLFIFLEIIKTWSWIIRKNQRCWFITQTLLPERTSVIMYMSHSNFNMSLFNFHSVFPFFCFCQLIQPQIFHVNSRSWKPAASHLKPSVLLCRRADARNVGFETLSGGQFTLSTQLIKPNKLVMPSSSLPHWCSTTVSIKNYILCSEN